MIQKSLITLLISILYFISVNEALQLGLSTKTPKVTKHKPKEQQSLTSLYRVNSTSGTTCILMQTDGLISIRYRNKLKEDAEADLYLPDSPEMSAECVESDSETFTMKFKGFILEILFKK
uniref:Uncharacterized protein n=1 Tax=Megaselia scalaris TaxID=36166 RepID=T1GLS6_MEGSC